MKQHPKGRLARLRAPIAGLILALVLVVHGPALHQALAAPVAPQQVHVAVQAAVQPGTVCGVATASVAAVAQQQDMPLPTGVETIIAAILAIIGGIATLIAVTGVGKWLAKQTGHPIEDNAVRVLGGGIAVFIAWAYAVTCNCVPGIPAFPLHGSPQEQALWLVGASGTLVLLGQAVWRKVVRSEPEVQVIAGESLRTG